MILVGHARGGAKDLAAHLMKDENERVVVHDLRGFASETLEGAFRESEAVSRGTRCKQHLFSLSLNPPPGAKVGAAAFEDAADRAEARLGLTGQPRALVFHDKRGADGAVRRHAHAVWCRIDADAMRARALPYHKRRLQDVARDLYHDHGWIMPPGLARKGARDPRNFTLAEWQQAKRAKQDPKALKDIFRDCWAVSDSKAALGHALAEHGYVLARGDRRGFVAVDHRGEVYALARWAGVRTRALRERLGEPDALPGVAEAHARAAKAVTDRLEALKAEQARRARETLKRLEAEKAKARAHQKDQARRLAAAQAERERREADERAAKLRTGLLGVLDRLTGRRKRLEAENALSVARAQERDRRERAAAAAKQAHTRAAIGRKAEQARQHSASIIQELTQDIRTLTPSPAPQDAERAARREAFKAKRRATAERPRRRTRTRDGPEPGR